MRRRLLPLVVLALAACSDQLTSLPDTAEIRLLNPVAWPGSDLEFVSSAFRDYPELPQVLLEAIPLAVTRRNDSTVAARLPDTSGTFAFTVLLRGGVRSGSVHTVGFVGERTTAEAAGWPLVIPGSSAALVSGDSTVVRINMATSLSTDLGIPHSNVCTISVGPNASGGGVVATGYEASTATCLRSSEWSLGGVPAVADSAPEMSGKTTRLWAELAPGIWFKSAHHFAVVFGASAQPDTFALESSQRLEFSPDRSTVVVLAEASSSGIPVLNAATGTVRFAIPEISVHSAAFSPDGVTVFFVAGGGSTRDTTPRLAAVLSASGIESAVSPESVSGNTYALTVDPAGPWLYASTGGAIQVFDRGSLRGVARLRWPVTDCCGQYALAVDGAGRHLYQLIVFGWMDAGPWGDSRIVEWDLVPDNQQAVTLSH